MTVICHLLAMDFLKSNEARSKRLENADTSIRCRGLISVIDDWRIPRSQSHFFWSPQTQTRSQRESGKIVFVLFFSWSPKTRRHHVLASVEVVPLHCSDYDYDNYFHFYYHFDHTLYLSFFLHGQNFLKIKFTLKFTQ